MPTIPELFWRERSACLFPVLLLTQAWCRYFLGILVINANLTAPLCMNGSSTLEPLYIILPIAITVTLR